MDDWEGKKIGSSIHTMCNSNAVMHEFKNVAISILKSGETFKKYMNWRILSGWVGGLRDESFQNLSQGRWGGQIVLQHKEV